LSQGRSRVAPEILAGLAGAIGSLPLNIAHGTIAFAPLGPAGVVAGAAASVLAAAIGGMLFGLLAGSRPLIGGPSAAVSLTIAGVLSAAVASGTLPSGAEGIGAAVVISATLTLLAGGLVGSLSLLRLGRAATLIPYPVLSGFLNGTAALLLLTQLGPLLGQPIGTEPNLAEARPLAALVAGAALAAMVLPIPGPVGRVPGVLRALVAGWSVDASLRLLGLGAWLGPLLGAPPSLAGHLDDVGAGLAAWPGLDLAPLLPLLLVAAATIAALIVFETLGTAAALRERGQGRADPDRDLAAAAVANIGAGAVGGVGICGSISATIACLAAGGTGRMAAVVRGLALLGILVVLGPLVALVPQAVLSGVILGTAWLLADSGTVRPLKAAPMRRLADAAVMGSVAVIAVIWSLAAAVAIGVALAVIIFTASMLRGVIRRAWRQPGSRSRIRRPTWAQAVLLEAGDRIEVVELEGALFFGTADAVVLHVERAAASGAAWIVLDLSRVTRVDLSGGRHLLRLVQRPPAPGTRVVLAGLYVGSHAREDIAGLALLSLLPAGSDFPSVEGALSFIEESILADRGARPPETAGEPVAALRELGLSEAHATRLLAHMQDEAFAAGAMVIRQGEPGRALYLLLAGTADITLPRPEGPLRLATLTAGAIFGEMAVITGLPRNSDVLARSELRCLRLDTERLTWLEREDPAVAAALLRAVARQIDSNLRMANAAIAALER